MNKTYLVMHFNQNHTLTKSCAANKGECKRPQNNACNDEGMQAVKLAVIVVK